MVLDKSRRYRVFSVINYILLGVLGLTTILPLIHVIALSFSSNAAVTANSVGIWPVGFNMEAYKYILRDNQFLVSMFISVKRVVIGTVSSLFFIVLTAYPLAQSEKVLRGRKLVIWFFVFTTLFSGGLIPTYLLIRDINLLDTFASLILPGVVPVFSVIMLMNYIKGLPKELFEACQIDGAGHITMIVKVVLPLSMPCLATLALFSMVGHWNTWFDATIYINNTKDWPLQSLMRTLINQAKDVKKLYESGDYSKAVMLSNKSLQAAQIVFSTLPILIVYPFLQKYFVTGITIGSVKG